DHRCNCLGVDFEITGDAALKQRDDAEEFVKNAYKLLQKKFGDVKCPLTYGKPHELCIAVILSAQCTDAQVNKTTPALFARFPNPGDYISAPLSEVENLVHSTGFYRNKAKNIQGFCHSLVHEHGGVVPRTLAELTAMPGVGRKTANVVLQELYGIPSGMVVDTHVARLSRIFGLTKSKNAVQIERDLMQIVPERMWMNWSLYMIFLGRSNCTARTRDCATCILKKICPAANY
ncbi:MAG TPA: endonuclease III, partial [Leptospiraceae bacterium]|nr:endonuclease III [Leptospiraceae bacterium]